MTAALFAALLWVCAFLIVYRHVGYPALLRAVARRRRGRGGERASAEPPAPDRLPSVTVIVPAHNEAAVIEAKIANLAALAYPPDRLSVLLALDGCTDETRAIAQAALARLSVGPAWRIVEYASNIGKVAVLNEQIGKATSDIVALSDASALVEPDALIRAAAHFADRGVGVVCGTYRLAAGSEGERAYWAYQTRVKADEAALAAPMGAHGAFYLFRRGLWSPLPADTINDDFILPMRIVLQGYRSVYDPSIVATELERSQTKHEFRRRVRIGAGNLQQVLRLAGLGDPRRGGLAFLFLSGKALRAVMPFIVIVALAATALLALNGSGIYRLLLAGEAILLGLALAGLIVGRAALPRPLAWLSYLVLGYAAAAVGSLLLLTGREKKVWWLSTAEKAAAAKSAG